MSKILKQNLEFDLFDKDTYTNIAVIRTKKLDPNMKQNTSLADGFVVLKKLSIKVEEIPDGDIDDVKSIGKFCCGSDGKVKILVDKKTIDTIDKAKEELSKYEAEVEMREDLEYEKHLYKITMVDLGKKEGTFHTILLNSEKGFAYMDNNIESIDLKTTNPIGFWVVPKLKDKSDE